MWEFLVANRIEEAKQIERFAEEINEVIAEGHPMYGHQCYSKALAAAAGYQMGDVRLPLTRFSELGQEGIDRRKKMVKLINEVEALAEDIQAYGQKTG